MIPKVEKITLFQNRREAGQQLARRLMYYAHHPHVIVLALPRGGVPVAFEVAKTLRVPMDIFMVRKLGVPGRKELALGAIASGGVRVLNPEVVWELRIPPGIVEWVAEKELQELKRCEDLYRGKGPRTEVWGQTVILIDDGLATGATMRAAVAALRQHGPAGIIAAVPVAGPDACTQLKEEVDEMICACTPEPFYSVGLWYEDFSETSEAEVRDRLSEAAQLQFNLVFEEVARP